MQIVFEDYLNSIKEYLPIAKSGSRSRFLQIITTASLRRYFIFLVEEGLSNADESSLRYFFKVKKEEDLKKGIQKFDADKFRPIKRFIDGKTETPTQENLEMIAILLDFKPRPFSVFLKKEGNLENTKAEENETERGNNSAGNAETPKNNPNKLGLARPLETSSGGKKPDWTIKKKIAAGIVGIFIVTMSAFGVKQTLFKDKECMQWQGDHYELMDCESEINNFMNLNPIIPYDEGLVNMKRIEPCDTTRFFNDYDKPVVWYHKKNNKLEYFNMCGLHPVTHLTLKPITGTIIRNHLGELESCK